MAVAGTWIVLVAGSYHSNRNAVSGSLRQLRLRRGSKNGSQLGGEADVYGGAFWDGGCSVERCTPWGHPDADGTHIEHAAQMTLPIIEPIRPVLSQRIPTGDEWRYEPKIDGFRGTLYVEDGRGVFRSKTMRLMRRFDSWRLTWLGCCRCARRSSMAKSSRRGTESSISAH